MKHRSKVMAGITSLLLVFASIFAGALPASAADTAQYGIQKTAVQPGPFGPGDTITYQITVNCSSTNEGGCNDTVLTDALPEPLMFNLNITPAVTVQMNAAAGQDPGTYDLAIDTEANSFTVEPALDLDASPHQWLAGNSMTITVNAMVKPGTDGTWDGETITNVAAVDGANAPPAEGPEGSSASGDAPRETPIRVALSKPERLLPPPG
ncbi:isopeptide-forming domain-containing fimbrial protein [Microbacterium sp. Mu-80]|uniref:Isopeptide-forming domain-containing fimbrial protein n=1 Tax=Microbacterium bandirmense TaxID=3122050 RepID=A0ABU8LAW3_9MICO